MRTLRVQCFDVAIERSQRNAERFGQYRAADRTAIAAKGLNEIEETLRAGHRSYQSLKQDQAITARCQFVSASAGGILSEEKREPIWPAVRRAFPAGVADARRRPECDAKALT